MLEGQIEVGNSLCLDSLRSVNDKQSAFAGSNGAGDFIAEIHVTRGIDQVKDVLLAVLFIGHLHRVAFNGNAPFTLQIHIVQHLFTHIPAGYCIGTFQEAIRKGAFPVINMRNDTEVSKVFHRGVLAAAKLGLFRQSLQKSAKPSLQLSALVY